MQVDIDTCMVTKAGAIRGENVEFLLIKELALKAANQTMPGLEIHRSPWLGWRPCSESFESFQPLWVIEHSTGKIYVDQQGRVHSRLTIEGKGGV